MKIKNCVLIGLIIMAFSFVKAQETILCSLQNDYIKIESTEDIPTITNNTDGTVTLTYQDQNITNIFADYIIYDFNQAYPNANPEGELIKYYLIVHGNRALINEFYNAVYPDTYPFDPYPNTAISTELIDLLDNKTYKLIKYCTESSEQGLSCPEGEQNIPDGFQLKITFQFDAETNMMHAETEGVSSCGNSFSIRMKGGYDDGLGTTDNTFQLWESEPDTSAPSESNQPCYYIEQMLYSILDIGCNEGANYGNIRVITDNGEAGQFVLERSNLLFAIDYLTFQDNALSVDDENFQIIRPFELKNNPYLQISNLNNQLVSVEIYNTSGQRIVQVKTFEENSLNISNLSVGLYFLRISNLNNQQKIFKFLKN